MAFRLNNFVRAGLAIWPLVAAGIGLGVQPASAYQIFFGEDLHQNAWKPLSSTPNAAKAETQFLKELADFKTEDFEGLSSRRGRKLTLSFPGQGKATLSGGSGSVSSVPRGRTNGVGRYATSGTDFFEVSAGGKGNFVVDFSNSVAAFGFYGIDIGDFGGQLQIQLNDAAETLVTVDNTIGKYGSTDGSVLFFGIIAESDGEEFTQASFLTTTGQGDVFGFDDMTIGSRQQVISEPVTLATLGIGLAGVTILRRVRRR